MEWEAIAQALFYTMATAIGLYAVHILSKLQNSVEGLNVKIAVVVEKIDGHERRIERLEDN